MALICGSRMLNRLYKTCKVVNSQTNCVVPYINVEAKTHIEIDNEINKCLNYIERPYYSYLLNKQVKEKTHFQENDDYNNNFGLP